MSQLKSRVEMLGLLNGLTIDLEDWRQLVYWKMTGEVIPPDPAVVDETKSLLNLLSTHGMRATFFVLGNIAETFPDLVRRIDEAGHEIASHGLTHQLVYRQTPAQFREEVRRAKHRLEEIVGDPIHGYRAPEFSITKRSWWALDILAEEGFNYDSSIYPIAGKRYGVPNAPLEPHHIRTHQGNTILEFPLTAIEQWGRRWPVAGGGYFGVLPYWVTKGAINNVNREGRPAVIYLHPYEFAHKTLHVPSLNLSPKAWLILARYSIVHNFTRRRSPHHFERLLCDFKFAPLRELMNDGQIDREIL